MPETTRPARRTSVGCDVRARPIAALILWAMPVLAAALTMASALIPPVASADQLPGHLYSIAGRGSLEPEDVPATEANLGPLFGISPTSGGGYLLTSDSRVFRVSASGIVSVVAGNGERGFSGDGGPATDAELCYPADAVEEPDGGVLIADAGNNRIRRVAPNGTITTVAGASSFSEPPEVPCAIFIGYTFSCQDDVSALSVPAPGFVVDDPEGGYIFSVADNSGCGPGAVYRVDSEGIARRVAGGGTQEPTNGADARAVHLDAVEGFGGRAPALALRPDGSVLITGDDRVFEVSPNGTIDVIAGTGSAPNDLDTGDGGPATAANLAGPVALAVAPSGAVFVADYLGVRIRRIDPTGIITTVAGNGTWDPYDENATGALASAFPIDLPVGVAVLPQGVAFTGPTAERALLIAGAPPSVSITVPASGAVYPEGAVIAASYECKEGTDGPGLDPEPEGCDGTVANGAAISTVGPGEHDFTVKASSSNGLKEEKTVVYTVVPAPTLTSIEPGAGKASGGTPVQVKGTNLSGVTEVRFGGSPVRATCIDTECSATSPAGTGTVLVTVETAGGNSNSESFVYVPTSPPPTVTALSPKTGSTAGGTLVTVAGTNFTGAETVMFGSTSGTIRTVSATSVTVESPGGTGTVYVTVKTPNGTSPASGKGAKHAKFKFKKPKR